MIGRYSFSGVYLGLETLNGLVLFDLNGEGLASESPYEDLLGATSESEDKVDCAFLLDVVVSKSSGVLEAFSCEDKSLLVGWYSFFVLYFCF